MKSASLWLYSTLLFFHLLHIIEESIANAWFIPVWYKTLSWFLVVNILLWLLAAILLSLLYKGYRWAYFLSFGYAGIMIIDGLDHLITYTLTQQYIDGAAGVLTGIAFLIISPLLLHRLYQEKGQLWAK
jgi:hypothetical protein